MLYLLFSTTSILLCSSQIRHICPACDLWCSYSLIRSLVDSQSLNVVSYTLHLSVIEYETAVLRGDLTAAAKCVIYRCLSRSSLLIILKLEINKTYPLSHHNIVIDHFVFVFVFVLLLSLSLTKHTQNFAKNSHARPSTYCSVLRHSGVKRTRTWDLNWPRSSIRSRNSGLSQLQTHKQTNTRTYTFSFPLSNGNLICIGSTTTHICCAVKKIEFGFWDCKRSGVSAEVETYCRSRYSIIWCLHRVLLFHPTKMNYYSHSQTHNLL